MAMATMMGGQQPASGSVGLQNRAQQAIGRARTMLGGPKPVQPMTKPLARPGVPAPAPAPQPTMTSTSLPDGATVGPSPRPEPQASPLRPYPAVPPAEKAGMGDYMSAIRARFGGLPGGFGMGGGRVPTGPDFQHPDFLQPVSPEQPPPPGGGMQALGVPGSAAPPVGGPGGVDVAQLPPKLQAAVAAGMRPEVAYQRAMMLRPEFAAAQGAQGQPAGTPATSLMDIYNGLQMARGGGGLQQLGGGGPVAMPGGYPIPNAANGGPQGWEWGAPGGQPQGSPYGYGSL